MDIVEQILLASLKFDGETNQLYLETPDGNRVPYIHSITVTATSPVLTVVVYDKERKARITVEKY